MGKSTAIYGIWVGFLAIVYFGIYRGFLYKWFGTTGDEAFIAFCSLALFFGQGGEGKINKKFWNFVASGICGAIWGWIFVRGVNLLMPLFGSYPPGPPPDKVFVPAALIDILVLTALAIFVHTFLLRNTIFNNMAYVFLGVATTFSGTVAGGGGGTAVQGLVGVLQISLLIICGILIGTGSNSLLKKIFGPPPAEIK